MAVSDNALIEAAVHVGLLSGDEIPTLRLQAKRERIGLVEIAARSGRFPISAFYRALADIRRIPYLEPEQLQVDTDTLQLLPRQLRQRNVLPVKGAENKKVLVLTDPDDRMSIDRAERAAGFRFEPALADPKAIEVVIQKHSKSTREATSVATSDINPTSDPVVLLDNIMKAAYLHRTSDIHFEPQENGMRIRIRVDGCLTEFPLCLIDAEEESLINRIKVLSELDIGEHHMTQDGAMKYSFVDWDVDDVDIRVAIIPSCWGERATLRILSRDTGILSLEKLGMSKCMLDKFGEAIKNPHGMILVTGPTGSGKSTTLYAAIRELDLARINVLTAEDPVEQTIEGITQVQVTEKVSFAQALRSFLRHDPDVVLVGEIRDTETVDISLRAAMTGHLVMSTLHTNNAIAAVTRMVDMGAERFLIGSAIVGVLAQRLGRRLCPHCRKKYLATAEELEILNLPKESEVELYKPEGCSFCLGTGFLGRIGFFEALWVNKELQSAIASGASENEVAQLAKDYTTLWDDCRQKVLDGVVPLSETLHYRPEIG